MFGLRNMFFFNRCFPYCGGFGLSAVNFFYKPPTGSEALRGIGPSYTVGFSTSVTVGHAPSGAGRWIINLWDPVTFGVVSSQSGGPREAQGQVQWGTSSTLLGTADMDSPQLAAQYVDRVFNSEHTSGYLTSTRIICSLVAGSLVPTMAAPVSPWRTHPAHLRFIWESTIRRARASSTSRSCIWSARRMGSFITFPNHRPEIEDGGNRRLMRVGALVLMLMVVAGFPAAAFAQQDRSLPQPAASSTPQPVTSSTPSPSPLSRRSRHLKEQSRLIAAFISALRF